MDWWSLFARSWPGLMENLVGNLGGFFGPFWHCPFRLVIAPEIACFIGFFGNWPRF
jgi:hypothetical protein